MHWDAQDPLHGGEDLGYFFRASVSSMLRDDNGLVDICNYSILKGLLLHNYSCDSDYKGAHTHTPSTSRKSSKLNVYSLSALNDSA